MLTCNKQRSKINFIAEHTYRPCTYNNLQKCRLYHSLLLNQTSECKVTYPSNSSSKESDEESSYTFTQLQLCTLPPNHRVNFRAIGNTINAFDSTSKEKEIVSVLASYVATKSSSQTFERKSTWSDGWPACQGGRERKKSIAIHLMKISSRMPITPIITVADYWHAATFPYSDTVRQPSICRWSRAESIRATNQYNTIHTSAGAHAAVHEQP